jgi:V/A-type H+-transporting ATPase subunit D
MAEKIKFTKNELQRQQRELKKYQRYLPTLQLKKQQLQLEVRKAEADWENKQAELTQRKRKIESWVELFSDYAAQDWLDAIKIVQVHTVPANIAGVKVTLFQQVDFKVKAYSIFSTPPWIDFAYRTIKELLRLREELKILSETTQALRRELRKTTQRVNLFEKVMIPRCEENIRVIKIYLGDEERNAVGRSKIAKKKLMAVSA